MAHVNIDIGEMGENVLFRDVPGFATDKQSVASLENFVPQEYAEHLTMVSEYGLVTLCLMLALFLLYRVGVVYAARRKSKKDVSQILNIN